MSKLAILRINCILIHLLLTVSAQSVYFLNFFKHLQLCYKVQPVCPVPWDVAKAGCGTVSQDSSWHYPEDGSPSSSLNERSSKVLAFQVTSFKKPPVSHQIYWNILVWQIPSGILLCCGRVCLARVCLNLMARFTCWAVAYAMLAWVHLDPST